MSAAWEKLSGGDLNGAHDQWRIARESANAGIEAWIYAAEHSLGIISHDDLLLILHDAELRFPRAGLPVFHLARAEERLGNWTASEKHWRHFIEIEGDKWWAFSAWADALRECGCPNVGEWCLESAVRCFPTEPQLQFDLAIWAEKREDWQTAVSRWQQALENWPEYSLPYLKLAQALQRVGKDLAANDTFEQALSRFPVHLGLIHDAARFSERRHDWLLARDLWKIYVSNERQYSWAFRSLAFCYQELGEYENAENTLTEALRLFPSEASVLADLASLSENIDDWPNAAERWRIFGQQKLASRSDATSLISTLGQVNAVRRQNLSERADHIVLDAIKNNPFEFKLYEAYALNAVYFERWFEAFKRFEDAEKEFPNELTFRQRLKEVMLLRSVTSPSIAKKIAHQRTLEPVSLHNRQHSRSILRRTHVWSWAPNGWFLQTDVSSLSGGTQFITVGVPDDFCEVRIGLVKDMWSSTPLFDVKACASAQWGDLINPLDESGKVRTSDEWSTLTFAKKLEQPSDANPATLSERAIWPDGFVWSWSDWSACQSLEKDPASGLRVLMIRVLVPGSQTVVYCNGMFEGYFQSRQVNNGFEYFVGGLGAGADHVTDPANTVVENIDAVGLRSTGFINGSIIACIQAKTNKECIVGMTTGDSHHSGASTTTGFLNYLLQGAIKSRIPGSSDIPIGLVNCAVGGMRSQEFFQRLDLLIDDINPSYVVLPGWTFNDHDPSLYYLEMERKLFLKRLFCSASRVRANGALPIWLTPFPRDKFRMKQKMLQSWLFLRDTIMEFRDEGELVVDASMLLGQCVDGRLDGTYKSETSDDNVHPNDYGHAILADSIEQVVMRALGGVMA